jgi:hypothetical protein
MNQPSVRRWKRICCAFALASVLAACETQGSGGSSGTIDPNDQDEGCHRAALASASNRVSNFQWNGTGMDVYRSEYEACLGISDLYGG